jgi:nucleotide-binding universal stress UspA family protein
MPHGGYCSTMRTDDLCILFPVDVEESTDTLLPAAKEMREIGVGEVRLLHVVHPVDALAVPDIIDTRKEILIAYRKALLEYGIPVVHGEVVIGTPWTEIMERAQSADIAFIVMGSQGKGLLQRIFLGSQTENVLYHTHNTLFIIRLCMEDERFRLSQEHLFTHVLYATDLSEGSRMGIPYLERMARISARLTIAHVEDVRHFEYASPDILHQMRNQADKELTTLKDRFLDTGFSQVDIILRRGNAISELLHLIDEVQPSLLVMGAKGTYDIAERALGGVAETLIHRAPVHILLCRK